MHALQSLLRYSYKEARFKPSARGSLRAFVRSHKQPTKASSSAKASEEQTTHIFLKALSFFDPFLFICLVVAS